MKESRSVYRCALITGVLLIITSLLHFFNINDTMIAIKTGDIAPSHASNAVSTWIFSGISMFMIGLWLLFLLDNLKKLQIKAWWQAFLIGTALVAFGGGCWLKYPKELHLLYFLLLGMILLIPLIFQAGRFRKINRKKENKEISISGNGE
jgi:hypothetical protein